MRIATLALIPFFLLLSGCQSRSIVGTWESTGITPLRIVFNSDSTFEAQPLQRNVQVTVGGKYELYENRLVLTEVKARLPEGSPYKNAVETIVGSMPSQDQTVTLSWKTNDEIILDGQGMVRGGFKRVVP